MRGRPWTFDEVVRMFELIGEQRTSIEVGEILGRNRRCIGRRAKEYGLSFDYQKIEPPKPPEKRDETENFAARTNITVGLAKIVEDITRKRNLSLSEVRSDCRRRELVKCRQEIAVVARSLGYSYPRIGRALNRDHTSIMHLVRTNSSPTTNKTGDSFTICSAFYDRIAA